VFAEATPDQALAVLGATRAVVDAIPDPSDARSGRGSALLVAAGRLLFRPAVDVDPTALEPVGPEALAEVVGDDRDLAEHAAALIAVASLADGRADPDAE
jgi:hypothetical protein